MTLKVKKGTPATAVVDFMMAANSFNSWPDREAYVRDTADMLWRTQGVGIALAGASEAEICESFIAACVEHGLIEEVE
jgi:hypothetical protein